MPLSYEDRIELLKKAREAKKAKQQASKVTPQQPINEDSESSEDFEEPKTIQKKTKIPNPKWLKVPEVPKKVKDVEEVSKEEYVIDDDKPVKPMRGRKVIKSTTPTSVSESEPEPVIKKRAPRKVKEPVRTLDIIAEPKAIEEVMEEVVNNDVKYKPKPRAKSAPKSNSITITKSVTPFSLFDY